MSNMPKKQKSSLKNKSKSRQSKRKNQRGGTNACALPYNNDQMKFTSGGAESNIHNTNPQASLDLDNKFMGYGGPVPLGSSFGGGGQNGGKCSDEGVGTSSPKSETFKQYLMNLDSQLSITKGGAASSTIKKSKNKQQQKGSGYSSDPSEFIGGQPVYRGYDDNSPPAIISGNLVFGTPDAPICGAGAVGGGRKSRKSKKSKKQRGGKKSKKSKKQRGGDFTGFRSSRPADYGTAFNGAPGVFNYPEDMTKRTFEETQPVWSPNAI